MTTKRILFTGYAPVHFLCFQPIYERLRSCPDVELFLSGGFRQKHPENGSFSYSIDGFYDPFSVDRERIIPVEQSLTEEFDVVVCSHTSDLLLPPAAKKSVQIFHGVSFKNLAVREKALRFDVLCLPGRYHAELYEKHGLLRDAGQCLVTGFAKADAVVAGDFDRAAYLQQRGLSPERPTVLFAPTGEKNNALDVMGPEVVAAVCAAGRQNLLVKPHDHPKKPRDWFARLARYEGHGVSLVRDENVIPCLRAADLLVTDASSVAVEYTLLDRPIVFLDVPGLLDGIQARAPALDLHTYGRKIGDIASGPEDVVPVIDDALAHPERHAELRRRMARHLFHDPGRAAEHVTHVIRHAAGLDAYLPGGVELLHPGATRDSSPTTSEIQAST